MDSRRSQQQYGIEWSKPSSAYVESYANAQRDDQLPLRR
jgi:hypothetical protein